MAKKKTQRKQPLIKDDSGEDHYFSNAEIALLRDTYSHVAYAVMPVQSEPDEARETILTLQSKGLLSDDLDQPVLTARGQALCRALSLSNWKR